VLTTGNPAAIASITDIGLPSQRDDSTNASDARRMSATSDRMPRKRTRDSKPSAATCSRTAFSSSPPPTSNRYNGALLRTCANASISSRWFF
jgi:hypothetical protein